MLFRKALAMPDADSALEGRDAPIATAETHFISGHALKGPYPKGHQKAVFGMGCFWGVEKLFWQLDGVHVTAAGYAAGFTPNPTYEEICTGLTGHNEVVLVVFDPAKTSFEALLKTFWEGHNPTQGMRQGNDAGTQYRSGIYATSKEQLRSAEESKAMYAASLSNNGYGAITTEIRDAGEFYFAEDYHQQYLAKNPAGYCGLGGTGISCPVGVEAGA